MARLESRARARALQALYAWDVRGQGGLEIVAARTWDDLGMGPEERKFASQLVGVIIRDGEAIDRELSEVTTNWRLERLAAVDRCVLRLAAAELTRGATPPKVVIQEAVRLAERYGSAQSARFVNGVVDALARRLGRL
jgi:N utilization substance protein B